MARIILVYDPSSREEQNRVMMILDKMRKLRGFETFGENCFIMNSRQLSMQAISKIKKLLSGGRILYFQVENNEMKRWPN